jgi:hypothetical protein
VLVKVVGACIVGPMAASPRTPRLDGRGRGGHRSNRIDMAASVIRSGCIEAAVVGGAGKKRST